MPDLTDNVPPGAVPGNVPPKQGRWITDICLALLVLTLWPLTHRYKGLSGDAELYAVQALARIHPNLAGDLFLQNNSQDVYTVFSPLYAWCIRWLGLRGAAMTLMIALKIWFFVAVWAVARQLFDRRSAFLSTACVMVIAGCYGGYSVFNYSEDWLTARSLAEPLVISAVLLYLRNLKTSAFLVAFIALLVHPLMALPGLLLLVVLSLPLSIGAAGAMFGVLATLAAALYVLHQPSNVGMLSVMDSDWLDIVRERSVFLFPQLWPAGDWEMNVQPFVSLAISAIVLREPGIRKLCAAVALVGATGLATGLIASSIGPVGLLLQGQAWRWVWIGRFTAVILLAPTLLNLWRNEKCGPLCAMLMVVGWTFTPVDSTACLTMSLILWLTRHRVTDRIAWYFRWTAILVAAIVLAWVVGNSWSIVVSPPPESGLESLWMTNLRNILGLGAISIGIAWSLICWVHSTSSRGLAVALSAVLLICCLLVYPSAFRVSTPEGSAEQIAEFSDWRQSIAPDDTVFVLPAHNSATFAWFTLERPSYLTVDQSAGVVFSRATALEVRRRANVLAGLMDPDWRLRSRKASAGVGRETDKKAARTLNLSSLIGICSDPKLKFVVAHEYLGFNPMTHSHVGNWKGWNLYDCRRVHDGAPAA
jgi:hypothetical protein